MKKRYLAALASLLSFNTIAAQAAPITYNFSVDNFESVFANPLPAPVNSITGSFTLEGIILVAIDLTIGTHAYSLSEVAYAGTLSLFEIGGKLNGISTLSGLSDDFMLHAQLQPSATPYLVSFEYTVSSINDAYIPKLGTQGSITIAPSSVPIPAAAWLFGSGLIGLVATARKRKAH